MSVTRDTLQHTATHCNTPATHCNTPGGASMSVTRNTSLSESVDAGGGGGWRSGDKVKSWNGTHGPMYATGIHGLNGQVLYVSFAKEPYERDNILQKNGYTWSEWSGNVFSKISVCIYEMETEMEPMGPWVQRVYMV